jgi:signal transduction histidine kinase
VLAARDGSLWILGDGTLSHLRNGTASCLRAGKELPGVQVRRMFEDHAGRLWVALDDGLWVYEHGTFRRIVKPDGSQIGVVSSITEDTAHDVWIAAQRPADTSGASRLLMRIEGLTVREEVRDAHMPLTVAADPTGGIWAGSETGGVLTRYHDGKLAKYRLPQVESAGIQQVRPSADGSVLVATTIGLLEWRHGDLRTLNAKNGLPCDQVNRVVLDDLGNLWLFLNCALGKLTPSELQKWRSHPDVKVSLQTFDGFDGGHAFFGAAPSQDGRLWFAGLDRLQMLDPARLHRNTVPPPVHIEQVIADRTTYPSIDIVRLPPRTRDLEIDYVALSFVAPQKVRFRYRLEGRDDTWQEPGTRRQAFYSDLRPRTYRFRVIASNNDGLWNEVGATLDIVVAPAWYQTRAFLVLSVVTGVMAVWALYRLRMRQLARTLTARFDERLSERTRLARDLHDTLLQTVRGTQIVADDALKRPDDATGMRRAMEHVSTWMGQASQEGRATLNMLRATTTEQNDLADAFRRAIEDCRREGSIQASLSVTGSARELHPVVRDEIYRIGYEAIRNACMHSGGSRLEVEVTYARDLTVRIADNGVGIEPAVADAGKDGHFGLQGMRERAARIGATLTVVSASGSGTDIVVVVPGRAIFRRQTPTLFNRHRDLFTN